MWNHHCKYTQYFPSSGKYVVGLRPQFSSHYYAQISAEVDSLGNYQSVKSGSNQSERTIQGRKENINYEQTEIEYTDVLLLSISSRKSDGAVSRKPFATIGRKT